MTTTIPAYPLQWPTGWKRTQPAQRTRAKFGKAGRTSGIGDVRQWTPARDLTITEATQRVLKELERMGLSRHSLRDDIVISSNLLLRLDGLPRSGQPGPSDPGVAVYWRDGSPAPKVMAIDRYDRVADNLAAVAATLEAMRAIERHGGAAILERAFTGFTALPAPTGHRSWRDVLNFRDSMPNASAVNLRYRELASQCHPDKPNGSHAAMAELNKARDEALGELS